MVKQCTQRAQGFKTPLRNIYSEVCKLNSHQYLQAQTNGDLLYMVNLCFSRSPVAKTKRNTFSEPCKECESKTGHLKFIKASVPCSMEFTYCECNITQPI